MNDKEINIRNLTPRQVEMLDIMWELEDYDEVLNWQETLDADERSMSETLMQMILLELVDETMSTMISEDLSLANAYLKKFQL